MLNKPKGLTFRVISAFLVFFLAASFAFPREALAYRSNDGGGDLAQFDFGKWALGTAVGIVSSGIGSALASGITSGLGNAFGNAFYGTGYPSFSDSFINSLASLKGVDTWATNYVTSSAVGQVQSAIGAMGNYFGWDPGITVFTGSVIGGAIGGGLAPGHFGSSLGSGVGVSQSFNGFLTPLKGVGIGLIEGSIEGAILMSAVDKKGRIDSVTGNVANLAGSLTTGALVGGLTVNKEFSFGNIGDFNFKGAGQDALRVMLRSIPSAGLSMGVQSITRGMDKQDAYIVKQAFSGAYYMVNMPTGFLVEEKAMPAIFGGPTRGAGIPISNTNLIPQPLQSSLNPNIPKPLDWNKSGEMSADIVRYDWDKSR